LPFFSQKKTGESQQAEHRQQHRQGNPNTQTDALPSARMSIVARLNGPRRSASHVWASIFGHRVATPGRIPAMYYPWMNSDGPDEDPAAAFVRWRRRWAPWHTIFSQARNSE
jgi:hypothetical protein